METIRVPSHRRGKGTSGGFTLIELMVVAAIIAIIAAIAYPSYINSVVKSKRAAAEGCLSEHANYMERYYTTNLRYDQDSSGVAIGNLPALGCDTDGGMANNYAFSFAVAPTASTYKIQAVPLGAQHSRDTQCGTLSVDQTGARLPTTAGCW